MDPNSLSRVRTRQIFAAAAMNGVVNPVVRALLRSPVHRWLSSELLILTVTGIRTGHPITFPVQYVRRGGVIYVLSRPERRWWRNLVGDIPISLVLAGRRYTAHAAVLEGASFETARAELAGSTLQRSLSHSSGAVIVTIRDLQPSASESR